MKRIVLLALVALSVVALAGASNAATIIVQNNDGAGEGFNDPTPVSPVGGNPMTTLGDQRLYAFQYAADIWGAYLASSVTILVDAEMNVLTCTPTGAVLGSAGTQTVHRDFTGAPRSATYYPAALANALRGQDLIGGVADIGAQFNSAINGDPGCLGGNSWYYGVDSNPPGGQIDFVTVVLHEIGHGLGFQTFMSSSGALFNGFEDHYLINLERAGATPSLYDNMTNDAQRAAGLIDDPNLRWIGTNANTAAAQVPVTAGLSGGMLRTHAPNPYQPGSSVSHWSTAVSPNEVMEPSYTGPQHFPGLALYLMQDVGWPTTSSVAVAVSAFDVTAIGEGVELRAAFSSTNVVTRVNVYRGEGKDGSLQLIDTASSTVPGEFIYVDASARPGETYRYRIGVVDGDGEFFSADRVVTVPSRVASLSQNFPNPFNPATAIGYTIDNDSDVELNVYDVAGRLVRTLVRASQGAGSYEARWDGRDTAGQPVASGMYFYRLKAGDFSQTRRMVVLR